MFDWIEEYMEMYGCDWDTAAREYHYCMHPETYDANDYDADPAVKYSGDNYDGYYGDE